MIETERLFIRPLSLDELVKYIAMDPSLETGLQLNASSRHISPELKEALEQTILPNVANPAKNYLYNTLWTIICKDEQKMVGDLCFIGEPNAQGEIEIGYGTHEEFRGKGFMTEAVKAMIEWAKTQKGVSAIIASTEKTNKASFAILEKNLFVKTGQTESLFHWRLEIAPI